MIQPSLPEFKRLAGLGNLVPIYREILADLETPVSAYCKVAADLPYAFLLESVQGGEKWGRYSLIGVDHSLLFHIHRHQVTVERPGQPPEVTEEADPLGRLQQILAEFQPVPVPGLPRFHGGAVGYLGYDVVRLFERLPDRNPDTLQLPDALFMLTNTVLIFDNLLGRLKVVTNQRITPDLPLEEIYQTGIEQIEAVIALLKKPLVPPFQQPVERRVDESDFQSEMSQAQYEEGVRKAKKYILAGDAFQVVLSHRLSIPYPHSPLALYRALRATNPSPYLFLLRLGDFSLVGSSPEILVRQEGEVATVRPIAGTRRRGHDEAEDLALEKELLADPKELAEHIMLVDLGRNDLGRVARAGTVQVTERFVIERYSHVMHIVSNVEGHLQPGLNAFDLIAATFPAGTVSGAPKIRAMEIIDELESSRRGPYAGAIGYISYSGHMDLAITIRTAVIKEGRLYIQAGAGIVADSQPDKEYEETMNKARSIFRAVDLVQQGLE